jgi:hypothetical protein
MKPFVGLSSDNALKAHDARVVWAVLCAGVFGLFRLGELLGPTVARDEDFEWYPQAKLVTFHLKSSKTDPYRHGCRVKMFFTGTPVDPYRALFDLMQNRPKSLGGATRNTATFTMSDGKVLTRKLFVDFMRALSDKVESKLGLGLNSQHFSGHSLRRGGATSLFLRGVPTDVIRTMGRWRSLSYRLYIDASNESLLSSMTRMAFVTEADVAKDLGVERQLSPNVPDVWTSVSGEEDD